MIEQLPPTLAQEHKSPLPADVDHPELPSPVGRPESPDEDVNADLAPDTEQAMVPIQQQAPDNQPWRIISEWNEIELQFNLIGELLGANTRNGSTLMNLLLRREYVSNEAVELFETLRKARNEAVHGKVTPNEVQVAEFVRQAKFVREALSFATIQLRYTHKDRRMPQ